MSTFNILDQITQNFLKKNVFSNDEKIPKNSKFCIADIKKRTKSSYEQYFNICYNF